MSTYDKIAWLPLCGGLTGVGLVLSYLAMRRRGLGSGLRWAAVSLLPLAAYLTGAVEMFWKIGVAIGDFATGFAFSPRVWSGIAVTGLAVVLFVASGPLRRRQGAQNRVARGRDKQDKQGKQDVAPASGAAGSLQAPGKHLVTRPQDGAAVPAGVPTKTRRGKRTDDDDDLGDVEDILRRHGIT